MILKTHNMVRASIVANHVAVSPERAISFGPFSLFPRQRLLLEAGTPVHIGSRALDLLIALVERPGELLSKDELISCAWPNTHVVEGNLKFQVSTLRRALREGQGGRRPSAPPPRPPRRVPRERRTPCRLASRR